jgi:hypothetical protein
MGLLDKVQDYFGRSVSETSRTADNKKIIDALAIEDDMDKFIKEDALNTNEANRLVHVMFKQIRQKNSQVRTNMELFLDQWAFHHGGLTKANFKEAIMATVKYGVRIAQANAQREDEAEFRAMQGPLDEFADGGPMRELPNDEAFEKYVLKQHPEFKKQV